MPRERDPMSKAAEAPENEPHPRASVSGMVMAEEAVSTSRSVPLADIPSRALDRLIAVLSELPFAQGEDAVAQSVVDRLAAVLPGCAVGLRVQGEGSCRSFRAVPNAKGTDRPSGAFSGGSTPGAPMFGTFAVELPARTTDESGLELWVAGNDPTLAEETSVPMQLAHRARFALPSVLRHARMAERLSRSERVLKERENQLVHTEKLASLGQLAAGMVHELNNPLTSIVAYTDYLAKRATARGDEDDLERLRRIADSAQRMLRLSRDLVTYARPSTGKPQPIVVSAVIEQALTFCDHILEEHGVAVERRFGDGVLPIWGMPEQLAQVFVNLFTNACHAMPPRGGKLLVSTDLWADDTAVRVVVGDNGHGIEDDHLPHLFDAFFTTKGEGRGNGLGLSIVKDIVAAHGGSIEVESARDEGTRFLLLLPVALSRR